ncbi:MAG: hypothetical protein U9Q88_02475 [Bacillota bacterium]|jgi:hypothetical protein|uniref:hypothetical protein n=1 Tax=Bacillus sp. RO2 TaxID=2723913 RepID=UPI00145E04EC|nr:hypothetical protein [Bacillus sp. RO2]MEA3318865.1 hypothetical protein [Bacillota bacterium]NMH72687.1 hypothetical protein [Bacillus sp. RO2]
MRSLQDTLYNWLTIKVVADARPEDKSAQDTKALFEGILLDDHKLTNIIVSKEEPMYYVEYDQGEERHKVRFPIELIDVMLEQIENEPDKYHNYE